MPWWDWWSWARMLAGSLGWGLVFLRKWCHFLQPAHHGMTRRLVHQGQTPATPAAATAFRCTQAHQQTATAEFCGLAKLGMPSDPRRKIFFFSAYWIPYNLSSSSDIKLGYRRTLNRTYSGGYPFYTHLTAQCTITQVNVCMCMLTRVTWRREPFGKGSGHVYTVFHCDMPAATRLHINYKEIWAVVRAVEDWAHS